MCRLLSLSPRMLYHCRLPPSEAIDDKAYAYENERDAENLPHVESHAGLEVDLVILDEFDNETYPEEGYEEYAENGTPLEFFKTVSVQCEQGESENHVTQGLIDLCRMMRLAVPMRITHKHEPPRQVGDGTVNLGVEEVAETYECAGEAHRDAEPVKNPEQVEIVFATVVMREPPHGQYKGDGASMACESSFPYHEYLPETFPGAEIIVRLVEQAVPEPCPHDCGDKQGVEQRIQQGDRDAFPPEEPFEYKPPYEKS